MTFEQYELLVKECTPLKINVGFDTDTNVKEITQNTEGSVHLQFRRKEIFQLSIEQAKKDFVIIAKFLNLCEDAFFTSENTVSFITKDYQKALAFIPIFKLYM